MRAIVARRIGGPEVLEYHENEPEPEAAKDHVLIRVRRAGINFADLTSVRGTHAGAPAPPFIPGMEVSGHEVATGRPVVAIMHSGGYAEICSAQSRFCWDVRDEDVDLGSGLPLATLTAYHALSHVARSRTGDRVLISAAAGGVGSAAIQVARALGATRVVGIASTAEKRAFARRAGADDCLGYDDELYGPFDVMVDMVGGDIFRKGLEAMATFGRVVQIGSAGGSYPEMPGLMDLRVRGVGVLPFSLGAYFARQPDRFAETARGGIELIRTGKVRPHIGCVLPLREARRAHELVSSRETIGKVVLDLSA
jgi:NADPH2:quinone reductase